MNKQAEILNEIIRAANPAVYEMLSERGKEMYFPKDGIPAQSTEAKGKRIDATIGIATNDDGSPMHFSSIAERVRLNPNEIFPYASSYGKSELRAIWKTQILEKNTGFRGYVSNPVVTSALTHGLSLAGLLFANQNDKIIMPDKFWGNYKLIFEHYGAKLEPFNMFDLNGFDTGSLREKLKSNDKKILLLNFPNNPTGYSPSEIEAKDIASTIFESADNSKIVVLIDDAYFGFNYEDDTYKESLFSLLSGIHKNVLAVKIDGATKEEYAWGLRIGFITYGFKGATEQAYTALEDKTAGAVRATVSNASQLSQSLVLAAMNSSNHKKEKEEKFKILKKRYEAVKAVLSKGKYDFHPLPFNSGYFMCVKLAGNIDGEQVRQILLKEYDTGVISSGQLLRIAFSSVSEKNIPELFDNIQAACRESRSDNK